MTTQPLTVVIRRISKRQWTASAYYADGRITAEWLRAEDLEQARRLATIRAPEATIITD